MKKRKIKNYLKIGILLFTILFINKGCSTEEVITENLTNNKYQSVNSNEATNFINSPKSKSSFNKTENGLNLNIDIKSLRFEKIKNSNLSMPLFQATTKNSNIKTEVFLIKINDSIHGFLLNRLPKKDSNASKFSGIISITNLNGHFINGYRVENGVFISQFVRNLSFKSNILLKTQTDPEVACDESLDPNSDFCNNSLGEVTIISSSNSSSTSLNITYTPSIDWTFSTITDTSGGGGTSSSSSSGTVEVFPCDDPIHGCRDVELETPPSCKSFNFVNTTSTWQEAAVINIRFSIYLINSDGISYKYSLSFPQPVLFGMPSNFSLGGEVGAGIAAESSANALNNTMSEIAKEYAYSHTSESNVEVAFKERLKYNYPLYIPGGRVNFNATNYSVIPTEYKTNAFGIGSCN